VIDRVVQFIRRFGRVEAPPPLDVAPLPPKPDHREELHALRNQLAPILWDAHNFLIHERMKGKSR
jgi:hypothetical protein